MRQQAMISFPVKAVPGAVNQLLTSFNLMDVPNMHNKFAEEFLIEDIHMMTLLYSKSQISSGQSAFSYYKYMGSLTFPPCEEYFVHFVVAQPVSVSTTIISSLREALDYPESSDIPQQERVTIDGSNRAV